MVRIFSLLIAGAFILVSSKSRQQANNQTLAPPQTNETNVMVPSSTGAANPGPQPNVKAKNMRPQTYRNYTLIAEHDAPLNKTESNDTSKPFNDTNLQMKDIAMKHEDLPRANN